ncbi:MAG: hypothetical protein MJY77_02800 [Bacteroidaceae bacterium]|nr:hypothetical protein [Bacteroidaceae bacterium]
MPQGTAECILVRTQSKSHNASATASITDSGIPPMDFDTIIPQINGKASLTAG